jgi:hypothetical protein
VEVIRQVLPGTGDFPRFGVQVLRQTQTGELPHRLNVRPCGPVGAVRRLAACRPPAVGTVATAPLIAAVTPLGASRYGWVPE